jgi:hypothetical protein
MFRRKFLSTVGASAIAVGTYGSVGTAPVSAEPQQEHYFNGFTQNSVGSTPSDLSEAYPDSGQGLALTVEEHTRREADGSERCLRIEKQGVGKDGVVWTDFPSNEDYELFCVWRSEDPSLETNRLKLLARASEDVGLVGGSSDSAKAQIAQLAPDLSELDSNGDAIEPGTEVAQRFRIVGDEAWLRVWEWGAREPRGWTVGPVPVEIATEGGIGLFALGADSETTDILVWEIGASVPRGPGRWRPRDPPPSTPPRASARTFWAPQQDPDLDFMSFPEEITHPLAANKRDIWYPDGWGESRDGGDRVHRAVDMYEDWGDDGTVAELPRDEDEDGYPVTGARVYAARGGVIRDWMPGHPDSHVDMTPGSGGGYQIHVDSHDDKYMYGYLHLGRDEREAHEYAYAPHPEEDRTIGPGDTVERGQHIGWLGESGVSGSGPHLHFEIRDNAGLLSDDQPSDFDQVGLAGGPRYDPYPVLRDAEMRNDFPSRP